MIRAQVDARFRLHRKALMNQIQLSVVVPAFNEELTLLASLTQIVTFLEIRNLSFEVLVIDDGSQDRTVEVAREFESSGVRVLSLDRNRGKGAAVRHGVLESRGAQVLVSDADLSAPIEDLPKLKAALGEAQLVFGSRALVGSRILTRQPRYRELMGKVFNLFAQMAGASGIEDTQCGFKLFEGEVARQIFADMTTDGFAWDVELVWLARQQGFHIEEVAVSWADNSDSRVSPVRDSIGMLAQLLTFRWRHWTRSRSIRKADPKSEPRREDSRSYDRPIAARGD